MFSNRFRFSRRRARGSIRPASGLAARVAGLAALAGTCCFASAAAFGSLLPRPGEELVSVAMHVHGSLSEGVGSMEWQSDMARRWGVDVIWWTDHDWRVQQWSHTRRFDFELASWDAKAERVIEPDDAYPNETRAWVMRHPWNIPRSVTVEDSIASEGERSLRIAAEDPFGDNFFRYFYLSQVGSRQQSRYSLASRVRLRFRLLPEDLDPSDAKFTVEVRLSDHPDRQHFLRYVAGSMHSEGADAIALPYQSGTWNDYVLNVTEDAIRVLSAGGSDTLRAEDNSLYEVRIGLSTRNGQTPVVFLDDYRIETEISGDGLLDRQRDLAAFYEEMYSPVTQFVGTEISRFRPQPHLNGYGADLTLVDYGEHVRTDTMYYAVEQIHDQGGVVSYNHAFGPWVYPLGPETPEEKAARILDRKRLLVGTRLLGADIFEVGYRWRGGSTLEDHLDTWDTLGQNAIFVTGNGTNDSHGRDVFHGWGPWQPNWFRENNFVTWVHTEEFSEVGLLRALKAGRAIFGDPNLFAGELDLCTGEGFPMGRILWTDRDEHELAVRITEVPPDVQVRLLQVEIRESPPEEFLERSILRDELLVAPVEDGVFSDIVALDTSVPSLARIEVRNGAGDAWVFSNPIYFVRELPAAGISPERLAVVREDAQIVSARQFTLASLRFEENDESLVIVGDELVPGAGLLALRTGRGSPSSVSGAEAWSYEAELLELRGFSGPGSTIEISWGDEPPPAITRVTLGRGYPNPFGEGIHADYAIPAAVQVRLVVLDVRGRLVRVLADGFHETGPHEADWDGRDETGIAVANGVYFLRLETAGETLTTKAVKVR